MSAYQYIGQAGMFWTVDKDLTREDADSLSVSKLGPYADLQEICPHRGDVLDDFPDYQVVRATLRQKPGKMGLLQVELFYASDNSGTGGTTPKPKSRRFNLQWRELNVPLFDGFFAAFGSDIQVALLHCWMQEPNSTLKDAYKTNVPTLTGTTGMYAVSYTETTLTGGTLSVAKRIRCGVQSYKISMPVMLIVELFTKEPIDVPPPIIATTAVLKARFPRIGNNVNASGTSAVAPSAKYWPVPVAGGTYSWICFGRKIDDGDKCWTVTWEWQGALPPQGLLNAAWGVAGAAFDPLYYPAVATTIPAGAPSAAKAAKKAL